MNNTSSGVPLQYRNLFTTQAEQEGLMRASVIILGLSALVVLGRGLVAWLTR